MLTLYFLIFFEFLIPQPKLNALARDKEEILRGISLSLFALGTLAVARHGPSNRNRPYHFVDRHLTPKSMLFLFWGAFAGGFFYMLMSVNFNPIRLVECFFLPRFEVPWGRGRFGDFKTLLYELGAVLYLVPPIAGVILPPRHL